MSWTIDVLGSCWRWGNYSLTRGGDDLWHVYLFRGGVLRPVGELREPSVEKARRWATRIASGQFRPGVGSVQDAGDRASGGALPTRSEAR